MANSRRELSESLPFACLHLPHLKASFGFDRFGLHEVDGRSPRERACPQAGPRRRASVRTSTREHCQPVRKFLLDLMVRCTARWPSCTLLGTRLLASMCAVGTWRSASSSSCSLHVTALLASCTVHLQKLHDSICTLCASYSSIARLEACAIVHELHFPYHPIAHSQNDLWNPFEEGSQSLHCSSHTHLTHRSSIARLKACAIDHSPWFTCHPITHSQNCLWNPSEEGFHNLHDDTYVYDTHHTSIARLKACAIVHSSYFTRNPCTHPKKYLWNPFEEGFHTSYANIYTHFTPYPAIVRLKTLMHHSCRLNVPGLRIAFCGLYTS